MDAKGIDESVTLNIVFIRIERDLLMENAGVQRCVFIVQHDFDEESLRSTATVERWRELHFERR